LAHVASGGLSRATALLVIGAGADPADPDAAVAAARRVSSAALGDPLLSSERVARASSILSAFPAVRAELLAMQRAFAARPPALAEDVAARGAVIDGRDIGTVVCPDA